MKAWIGRNLASLIMFGVVVLVSAIGVGTLASEAVK